MSKNFVTDGIVIEHVPAADVDAGDPVKLSSTTVAAALEDIAAGQKGLVRLDGVFDFPCALGGAVKAGQPAHWDASAQKFVNAVDTANDAADVRFAGVFAKDYAAAATQAHIRITPNTGQAGA